MSKHLLFLTRKFSLVLLIFSLTSCTSTTLLSQRGSYLRAYHSGSLEEAEQNLNGIVEQELLDNQYVSSKNASWILLDRATTRFTMGQTNEAIQDFAKALESMDYYKQDVLVEQLSQTLFQDEESAYQATDYEQVLARIYFALALLHQGDENNAFAILRQAEEFQQEKQALYQKVPFTCHYQMHQNGLSKYLFACLLEKRGDITNANILFQQALSIIPSVENSSIHENKEKNQATVLVICHNGNAPYKISSTCPASVASAAALEFFMATQRKTPALSTLTGIPVPILEKWPGSHPLPTYATFNKIRKPLLPFYNLASEARYELEQKTPIIVARGVARLALRRAAVGCLDHQNSNIGFLADMTMLVINSNTRADTRSWTTLPAVIDMARFNLDPGCHDLNIQIFNGSYNQSYNYSIQLKKNDLCIIHVFNLHPGISRLLIPARYLQLKEGFYEK